MNKRVILIFFATMIILLTAIVLGIKKTTQSNELVFWTLQMRDFTPYMEKVITNFEKNNPEIKIKWVDIPFSEGEKRTLAAILSKNPPDLINLNPDFSTLLAQKGTLTEINDNDLTQFPDAIVKNMQFNKKNYFIPWYATSALTFYNKKKISKPLPATYDEVLNLCDDGQQNIMMFNFSENDTMLKLLNKYGINSDEQITSTQAETLYKNLQNAYDTNCFPKESLTQTHRESLEKFMAGETAIFEGGANFLNLIKENAPQTFNYTGIAHQITGKNGKYNYSIMNFIIPIKSKKQDEALKFALFLTNEKNQLELAQLTNVLATNRHALANEFYTKANKEDLFAQARVLSAKQLQEIQNQPFYQNRKEIVTLINNSTQKILLKEDEIGNILKQLKKDWEKLK